MWGPIVSMIMQYTTPDVHKLKCRQQEAVRRTTNSALKSLTRILMRMAFCVESKIREANGKSLAKCFQLIKQKNYLNVEIQFLFFSGKGDLLSKMSTEGKFRQNFTDCITKGFRYQGHL